MWNSWKMKQFPPLEVNAKKIMQRRETEWGQHTNWKMPRISLFFLYPAKIKLFIIFSLSRACFLPQSIVRIAFEMKHQMDMWRGGGKLSSWKFPHTKRLRNSHSLTHCVSSLNNSFEKAEKSCILCFFSRSAVKIMQMFPCRTKMRERKFVFLVCLLRNFI